MPGGYKPASLKRNNRAIRLHYAPGETYGIGVQAIGTPLGNEVAAYDLERCVCDLVKKRRSGNADAQLFSAAIRQYFKESAGNLGKLMEYAKALGVYEEVYKYSEVLA